MSQINKEIEAKILIAEKLIKQMEDHRDQANNFQEVARILRELNEQITLIQEHYGAMEPDVLTKHLSQIQNQCQNIEKQVKANGELASEIQQQLASAEARNKKWFFGLSAGLLVVVLATLGMHLFLNR